MKPWYKKKKTWATVLAVALGLWNPASLPVFIPVLALLTGVVVEGVVDAASALGTAIRPNKD